MTDNVKSFGGATGRSDDVLIHISELIVFRHNLDFQGISDDQDKNVLPSSARIIAFPPVLNDTANTVLVSLSPNALEVFNRIVIKNAPTSEIPRSIEVDGVTHIARIEDREVATALRAASFLGLMQGIFTALYDSLDVQFPFLKDINVDELFTKLLDVKASRILAGEYLDQEVVNREIVDLFRQHVSQAKSVAGNDWLPIKTDHNLANEIQKRALGQSRLYGVELKL